MGVIQRNALESWRRLGAGVEVIVFGDEEGVAEVCAELGLRHVPEVARNEFGTPLLDDMFSRGEAMATHELVAYVNGDIILLPQLLEALEGLRDSPRRFLAVGQRTNVEVLEPVDFAADWQGWATALARAEGVLAGPQAIDYFCWRKGTMGVLPPFAVGRVCWDNYMIWQATQAGGMLVDLTSVNLALHQRHDYGHLAGGMQQSRTGPEAQRNLELAGGWHHIYNIGDATHVLVDSGLRRATSLAHLRRRAFRLLQGLKASVISPSTRLD